MSRIALTGGNVVTDRHVQAATVLIDGGTIVGVIPVVPAEDRLDKRVDEAVHDRVDDRVVDGLTASGDGEKSLEERGNEDRGYVERGYEEIPVDGCYIVPGYIDLLAHGALGFDFYTGPYDEITRYFAAHGTTSVFAGLRSAPLQDVIGVLETFESRAANTEGAQVLGAHLESIYYNPEWCGAQSADQMRHPGVEEVRHLVETARGWLKIVSIAPELPHAIDAIRMLVDLGVRVSIGHTDATPKQMDQAIWAGASMVTHLFNATGGPFFKEPGVRDLDVSMFALMRDALTVQIIADGIHVEPDLFLLTLKAKGPDRVALITDASSMAGLPDGHYSGTFGREFVLKDGACRLKDGRLAASRLTLDHAVKNTVSWGVPLADAVHMASFVPARAVGLDHQKGRIASGYDADLVVLDEALNVQGAFIAGKTVYSAQDRQSDIA